MKIAILTNAIYPQDLGGAGRMAATQAEGLRARGHEVRVFRPSTEWLSRSALVRLFHHLLDLGPRQEVVAEILAWQPDVLITHNLTACGFVTPARIQAHGIAWLHILHDVQLFEPSGRLNRSGFTLWQRWWGGLRRFVFGKPDTIISPTKWLLDEHSERGFFVDLDTQVIPNPGLEPLSFEAKRHNPIRLLFIGGVSFEKGVRCLIDLDRTLSIPVEWHVIGDGTELELIKDKLPKAVFYGKVEQPELIQIMREMDILLVPSRIAENQPTVILEAAAVGLPVVASAIGGIPETLQGAGSLCDPDDVEAWSGAITKLASSPGEYALACDQMRRLAGRYRPEVYFEALETVLVSKRKTVTSSLPKD